MVRKPAKLEKDGISLREITAADTALVVKLRNNEDVRKCFTNSAAITTEGHERFLQKYFLPNNNDELYIVEYGGSPAGMISLYNFEDGKAEWGRIMIDPSFQGKGIGKTALQLIIERARMLGIKTLYCHVKINNVRAVNLYKSLGFKNNGEADGEFYMDMAIQ